MSEPGSVLPWTDEQWAMVQRTAAEAARRARVASTFLPLVGPLPEDQSSVQRLELEFDKPARTVFRTTKKRLSIDDGATVKLATLACEVFVRTSQAQDPELAAVRQMVSRAAVAIGRLEDAVVMHGLDRNGEPVSGKVEPRIWRVSGGEQVPGLRDYNGIREDVPRGARMGESLVKAVANAVQRLEAAGQYGPFGAMFGHELYEAAHRPSEGSLVLPADRFVPFLAGGPLLRSTVLPKEEGIVVASGDCPVDLVIASDVHVSYVQRTPEPRYVLRVSERMVLRIKQPDAIAKLRATGKHSDGQPCPKHPCPCPCPCPCPGGHHCACGHHGDAPEAGSKPSETNLEQTDEIVETALSTFVLIEEDLKKDLEA